MLRVPLGIVSEPTEDEIISAVTSAFEVTGMEQNPEMIRFRIGGGGGGGEADDGFKARFVELAQRLEDQNVACRIQRRGRSGDEDGEDGGLYLTVQRLEFKKRGRLGSSPWVPRILFGIVVAFVMVDGYYRTIGTNQIIPIGDPMEMAVIYTVALLGILGVHEMGHLVASRMHGIRTTWPYFIPGLPIIGIPTFGALIMAKGLMINREKTFDVAIAGPIAGLVVTVIVAAVGAATAPVIDPALKAQLYEATQLGDWQFGEPLLMTASLELFGRGAEGDTVLMTPLLFAAWVGSFLTFANLMPAGQLDGGHMMRTVFGARTLRIFTYVSAGILVLMNFWFVALFILFMGGRRQGITIMDEITPLSRRRIASYAAVMALAVLCAPIPDGLTVIEPLLHLIQQPPSA